MKKILLGTVALVALGATAPALAADLAPSPRPGPYTKAPAYVAPIYNWTGFYIGGHIGGAFAGNDNSLGNNNGGSFLGGVQGGADYQFATNWVIGVEAQYSWLANNNNNGAVFSNGTTVTSNSNQLGSATGRIGYTWGPGLLYVKGGYAFKDNDNLNVVTAGGLPAAFTTSGGNQSGYTVGAGLEYMFAPSWSAKIEYMYYNFGNTTFTSGPIVGARFTDTDNTIKAGINYRFNWGNPGPVVGKY
jgi:outer membrane immunogenic protein